MSEVIKSHGKESLAGLGNVFGLIIAFIVWAYFARGARRPAWNPPLIIGGL